MICEFSVAAEVRERFILTIPCSVNDSWNIGSRRNSPTGSPLRCEPVGIWGRRIRAYG